MIVCVAGNPSVDRLIEVEQGRCSLRVCIDLKRRQAAAVVPVGRLWLLRRRRTPRINPYTDPYNIVKVGTITVSSSGTFSVKNVKWTAAGAHGAPTKITFSKVSGRFTTAKKATGAITSRRKCKGRPAAARRTATRRRSSPSRRTSQ